MPDNEVEIKATVHGSAGVFAKPDSSYSFTAQFLCSAVHMAKHASAIESRVGAGPISDDDLIDHRGHVVAAILQAVCALESEIWQIYHHGPGHHLGSSGVDSEARDFLLPIIESFDRVSVLDKYRLLLHLLKKEALDPGAQPWQDAALAVALRNEIVHYKSLSGTELDRKSLFKALHEKSKPYPPFQPSTSVNFFPHLCLSASCGAWAAASCISFIDAVYEHIGIASPLDAHRPRLTL